MKALVKSGTHTRLQDIAVPILDSLHDVLIQVHLAGICRTDINVSKGIMPSAETLVLGHEFYGMVTEVAPHVQQFKPGDKVTIDPSRYGSYQNLMCGIDVDGAFSEYIKAPAHSVYSLPEDLSPEFSAYIEPIAASLAVFNAPILKDQRGCIYGNNRIAKLTHKIMQIKGYDQVIIHQEEDELPSYHYDYIIETVSTTRDMARIVEAVKMGGLIILKSRQVRPVEITLNTLVRKEITMHAVNYRDYDRGY